MIAGAAGTTIHALFMYFKTWIGLLPSFQPYQSFQIALSHWIGTDVSPIVPLALSFYYRSTAKQVVDLALDLRDASKRFEHLHRHGLTKSIAARDGHNPNRSPRIALVDAFPPARWRAFAP